MALPVTTCPARLGVVFACWSQLACASEVEPSESSTGDDTASTSSDESTAISGESTGTEGSGTTSEDPSSGEGSSSTGPPADDPCSPLGEPGLEVGHGDQVFQPFDAGDAPLIAGVQGGYHIFIGVRGRHLDSSGPAVVRLTGTIDGEQLGFSAPYADLVCADEGLEAANLLLIWDSTPDVLDGKTAHIEVELTDAAGTVVSTDGDVTIDAS